MKKSAWICLLCIALLICGVLLMASRGMGISTGTCIEASNGRYLILLRGSPIAMHQRSGEENIFRNLDTGDKLLILHDGIAESYPGKTGVYLLLKLADGDASDVPEDVIGQLRELGWLNRPAENCNHHPWVRPGR